MKKTVLILLILITELSAFSQNTQKPEFPKRPYYYQNDVLTSLPKEETKQKGLYTTKYILNSPSSSVSFNSGNQLEFIFEFSGDQDIDGLFSVVIAEVSSKGRTFSAGGFKAFGGATKDNSDNEISYEIQRVEGNIYKMVLKDVPNGEYAIIPQLDTNQLLSSASKVYIYTFGVK